MIFEGFMGLNCGELKLDSEFYWSGSYYWTFPNVLSPRKPLFANDWLPWFLWTASDTLDYSFKDDYRESTDYLDLLV